MKKDLSQPSTLHGWANGNLCKMGVAGSDLGGKNETTHIIFRIAGNKGRRRDRITAGASMEDVIQYCAASLARSIHLVHLGVDTALVSHVNEPGGVVETAGTTQLISKVRV